MKLNLYSLFLSVIILASCVKNNDEITNNSSPEVGEVKPLTNDNLIGTWQNYYFLKKLDAKYNSRLPDFDGASITFFKDGDTYRYFEKNANGKKTLEGMYNVQNDAKSFELTYYWKPIHKDSTEIRRMDQFTGKRFVSNKSYIGLDGKTLENDITFWRNMETMPDLYPNASKIRLFPEQLVGEWKIKASKITKKNISSGEVTNPVDLVVGKKYQLFFDKTFTEKSIEGVPQSQGTYRVVDDVVHLFYKNNTSDSVSIFNEYSASLQITEISANTFKVYDTFYYYDKDKENNLFNIVTEQLFERMK